ncbi:MAG: dihydroneopterin aldolase [Parachlamydiales bacterium]|nr:dihydroneopterin aldolase [Parachlamydiales bacterium]
MKQVALIAIYHHLIKCIIGIHHHERVKKQTLYVDIEVKADISACAEKDCITSAPVDYTALAKLACDLAHEKRYQLVETFAIDLVNALFDQFPIEWAKVVIKKPMAISSAKHAKIELERSKTI